VTLPAWYCWATSVFFEAASTAPADLESVSLPVCSDANIGVDWLWLISAQVIEM
jgi:hypothetical protein